MLRLRRPLLRTLLLATAPLAPLAGCSGEVRAPHPPFQAGSPWPKFRHDAAQTGRTSLRPRRDDARTPWTFATGKGIFSSPVVGADETVYVGSADRRFYAIRPDGTERWSIATGEIIDSAAVLDDRGRLYFGSGDGFVRALDTASGAEVWRFEARDPAETGAFIRWFEGNVAMGLDGTLYAPNDNFQVYAIDRDDGTERWAFDMPDQTWSSPAIDLATGRLFLGNNNLLPLLGDNIFAITEDGTQEFSASALGTVAASPVFVAEHGLMVVGGFDGYVRAYRTDGVQAGTVAWEFATRDHIYSSPALDGRGRIIQPSADGTVYALDAATGSLVWQFDARDPFRSSPAVDGDDTVYVGGGDGRVYVLNADGTLRFRMRVVDGERNDLNSSPALGRHGVYLGGESGGVFFVPYDYCLGPTGLADPRCDGPATGEGLPADGATLYFTTQLGDPLDVAPSQVSPNQPLPFSLFVRGSGDTRLALIDDTALTVTVTPAVAVSVVVSPDRRFVTVVPEAPFSEGGDGKLHVRLTGPYLEDPTRVGLATSGGTVAGSFDRTFDFDVRAPSAAPSPFVVPTAAGESPSGFALRRVAAPLPTILPSYNQIGFDSLYFVGAMVEGTPESAVAWIVGGLPDASGAPSIDPASRSFFPVKVRYDQGSLTLSNEGAFALEAYTLRLTFDRFRLSTSLAADGTALETPTLFVSTVCAGVQFYGPFLEQLGFCNPTTGALTVTGAALYQPHGTGGRLAVPTGVGAATLALEPSPRVFRATLVGSSLVAAEHTISLLVVDATTGEPVLLDYGTSTQWATDGAGLLTSVAVTVPSDETLPATMRVHLLVDLVRVATATVTSP